MRHTIRRFLSIVVTESWSVVWDDDEASTREPEIAGDGSHLITWAEGEDPPAAVILRRRADGSGWQVESYQPL